MPINFDILGNPINWLTIVIVLIFVSYATYTLWEISPLTLEA